MTSTSIGTPEQLRDPNYTPALTRAIPLGIQHVLAMFVSNVTPAIIIAGAAGFGFGSNSPDFPELLYLIQMSMLFAGVATLLQTITIGPVGAALPIVQGTSFAFIPIMIPLVAGKGVDGLAALFGGIVVGGLFHACLGLFIGKIRFALPPLVTGLVVTMIGLALVQGRHPVRRRRGACHRHAGIWQSAELVGGAGGDPGHPGAEVLYPGNAVDLCRADRVDRGVFLCGCGRHAVLWRRPGRDRKLEQRRMGRPAGSVPLRL